VRVCVSICGYNVSRDISFMGVCVDVYMCVVTSDLELVHTLARASLDTTTCMAAGRETGGLRILN
jgi:hypothetical protein